MELAAAGYKDFAKQATMRQVFRMGVKAISRGGGLGARVWAWGWRIKLMMSRNTKPS